MNAPAWLDSPFIYYRLAFQDAARPRPTPTAAGSALRERWPAACADGSPRRQGGIVHPADGTAPVTPCASSWTNLSRTDAPGQSKAVVRLRASVLGKSALIAQRSFSVERRANTPDAEGGVRALIEASDEAVDQLVAWTVASLKD
jgi:cholesterol transport system auxiliary component